MSAVERVVIVGAGAAGLSTAAALTRRGIDALVIDRSDRIGGSWASRYERLHLHTIRRFSGLAHHGIPTRYPRYLSKDEYAAYLGEYAKRFGLRVALGEDVTAIHPAPGEGHTWKSTRAEDGRNAGRDRRDRTLRGAADPRVGGHPRVRRPPDSLGRVSLGSRVRGLAGLVGRPREQRRRDRDRPRRAGRRRGLRRRAYAPPIVTREMFGVVPCSSSASRSCRSGSSDRRSHRSDASETCRRRSASLRNRRRRLGPFTARRPAVIDVGFLEVLKAGQVTVRPALARLDQRRRVRGWLERQRVRRRRRRHGIRDRARDDPPQRARRRVGGRAAARALGQSTAASGLYFIGFDETIRGHLFGLAGSRSASLAALRGRSVAGGTSSA